MITRDFKDALYPVLGLATILVVWQLYVSTFGISRIVLPGPIDIAAASLNNWSVLLKECWPTLLESLLGFGLAVAVGIPVAVCVASSRVLNLVLYPILVATQSISRVCGSVTNNFETCASSACEYPLRNFSASCLAAA